MNPTLVRQHVIAALATDPLLQQVLVFKGGSAIEIAYGIVARGSIDLDFAIAGDFANPDEMGERIRLALASHFGKEGFQVFDFTFEPVPSSRREASPPWWGGYKIEFKLIDSKKAAEFEANLSAMRRNAMALDPEQHRKFRVDISKFEYCAGKVLLEVNGVKLYAYSEEMIALEKLRAICQQMTDYRPTRGNQSPARRARDFFDIHAIVTDRALDLLLPENLDLCGQIFGAKGVPIGLLNKIESAREFHRVDWDSVTATVPAGTLNYDFYFDFVEDIGRRIFMVLEGKVQQ